jgi:phosphate transport system substrate-binding protein
VLKRLFKSGTWAVALMLVLAACGGSADTTTTSEGTTTPLPTITLAGSGATFPAAFYEEVFAKFMEEHPEVTVTYNPVGSGQGQSDLAGGLVDFAGSDSLVKEEDKANFQGEFLYVPTVAAPITVSYNLAGVDNLQLSPETLAKIFQGEITSWDDPAIAADNPDVTMPSTAITVVHRSDGSGTTANFTAYLVAAAGDTWTLGSDKTVDWPASTIGAEKNTGVGDKISTTDGAIGYVDFSDARAIGLNFAAIQNADGNYVAASLEASSAALGGAELAPDVTYNPLNAPGADSYPIVAPTYILVYSKYANADTVTTLKALLEYVLGPAQDMAEGLDFAKLPDSVHAAAVTQVESITAG